MKKKLLKLALVALFFVSNYSANAQVSVFFPATTLTPQADICAGDNSAGMAVIYNTTMGSTTSATWSIISGPVDAVVNTPTTSQTSTTNTITAGTLSGLLTIEVLVSNTNGPSTSKLFTIDIKPVPGLASIAPPAITSICPGGSGVVLTGTSTDADGYVWYNAGVVISGATTATYTATAAGTYTTEGTNACGIGITSNAITITTGITTVIDSNPSDVALAPGQMTATFSITASGTNLMYSWLMNGSTLSDGGDFGGTTTSTLSITGNAPTYVGNNFICVVTGDCGSAEFSAQAVLPIDLVEFTGKFNREYTTLNWITASENNNNYFAIERSYDGKEFTAISKIEGAGDSDEFLDYAFEDHTVLNRASSNTVYYRLMQVDFDGGSSYSDIITVNIVKKNDFDIKNIVQNAQNLEVFITATANSNLTITIYDLNGRVLNTKNVEAIEGYNMFDLDINAASNGLYIISIVGENSNMTKKVFLK